MKFLKTDRSILNVESIEAITIIQSFDSCWVVKAVVHGISLELKNFGRDGYCDAEAYLAQLIAMLGIELVILPSEED